MTSTTSSTNERENSDSNETKNIGRSKFESKSESETENDNENETKEPSNSKNINSPLSSKQDSMTNDSSIDRNQESTNEGGSLSGQTPSNEINKNSTTDINMDTDATEQTPTKPSSKSKNSHIFRDPFMDFERPKTDREILEDKFDEKRTAFDPPLPKSFVCFWCSFFFVFVFFRK